jgi:hypothetical protein
MEQIPISISNPDLHFKLRKEYWLEEYQKASQELEKSSKKPKPKAKAESNKSNKKKRSKK